MCLVIYGNRPMQQLFVFIPPKETAESAHMDLIIILDYESIRKRRLVPVVVYLKSYALPATLRFLHHQVHDRRQMRLLKGSATARTLLGFLPLALSSLTTVMGSETCQQVARDGYAPEIEALYRGNKAYIANTDPALLQSLADEGQSAYCPFVYFVNPINLTCSPCFTRAPVYAVRLFR